MAKARPLSITTCLLALTLSAYAQQPIDVFVIRGQSNAIWPGVGGDTPAPTPPTGKVLVYSGGSVSNLVDPSGTGSAWPSFGIAYFNATGRAVALVPTAVSGSAMAAAADLGLGNWDTTGSLYGASVSAVSAALSALQATGHTPTFRGVLFHHGETDGLGINNGTITGSTYQAALANMIARDRVTYGASMQFYIFRMSVPANYSDVGFSAVRDAQEAVATADPNTHIVWRGAETLQFRGLLKADGFHYLQAGYNEMGRVGGACVAFTGLCDTPSLGNTGSFGAQGFSRFAVGEGSASDTDGRIIFAWTGYDHYGGINAWRNGAFAKMTLDGAPLQLGGTGGGAVSVGAADAAKGLTFYDLSTKAPYCLAIVGGSLSISGGAC